MVIIEFLLSFRNELYFIVNHPMMFKRLGQICAAFVQLQMHPKLPK